MADLAFYPILDTTVGAWLPLGERLNIARTRAPFVLGTRAVLLSNLVQLPLSPLSCVWMAPMTPLLSCLA